MTQQQSQSQYDKMVELREALCARLTQGVYNDEAGFCDYVATEHPDAVRSEVRTPGTDERDTWVNVEGKVVAIWNTRFQVGAAIFSNIISPKRHAAAA
jgi:hypothetical protein